MANNKRARLLAAATVNGKRSYYKPAMRSNGWPDPQALIVGEFYGRSVWLPANSTAFTSRGSTGRNASMKTWARTCYDPFLLEGKQQSLRALLEILYMIPAPPGPPSAVPTRFPD